MKLTRRSNLFLALICLAGIAQQWTEAAGPTWWRYGAALVLSGLLFEWLRARGSRLRVDALIPGDLKLGRQTEATLRFVNGDGRQRDIECVTDLPAGLQGPTETIRLCLPPDGQVDRIISLIGQSIGEFEWQTLPMRVRGSLGLAWWSRDVPLETSVSVVPDPSGQRWRLAGTRPHGETVDRQGSGLELHHLREYRPGDSLHVIHWKASARAQKLISRVMTDEQQLEIMLVIDIGRTSRTHVDGMSRFGHYINLAWAFSQFALTSGDAVGLVAAANKPVVALPPLRGAKALVQVHSALRRLRPVAEDVDMLGAALEVQRLARKRSLVILVTDLYSQSLTGSFGQSIKLWNIRHLPLVAALTGEDVTTLSGERAADEGEVYASLAAREYHSTLQANGEAARRLGASTVIARASDLQPRIFAQYRRLRARRGV